MDATSIAVLVTACGGFIVSVATAMASLVTARQAQRTAIAAELSAASSERAFHALLEPTKYVKPAGTQSQRFQVAISILSDGAREMSEVIASGSFPNVSVWYDSFSARCVGLLPDRPFPAGARLTQALSELRLCVTRAMGARCGTGTPSEWKTEAGSAMRAVELALVTAIARSADFADEWAEIRKRHS
jgi:hypothetical protein